MYIDVYNAALLIQLLSLFKIYCMSLFKSIILLICWLLPFVLLAQPPHGIAWGKDGNGYYESKNNEIVYNNLAASKTTVVASKEQLTPNSASQPLKVRNFFFSDDGSKLLIYTNTKRVWRYDTKGDYWLMDITNHTLKQLGAGRPESSLMFAPFAYKIFTLSPATFFIPSITVTD